MLHVGHVGAAMLCYAPIGFAVVSQASVDLAIVGGGVAVALSTLPDVDHKIPGIDHRGVTHTIYFTLLIGALAGIAGIVLASSSSALEPVTAGLFGFVIGTVAIGSHILADALTPMGVDPFLTGHRYSLGVTTARSPFGNVILLGIGLVAVLATARIAGVITA